MSRNAQTLLSLDSFSSCMEIPMLFQAQNTLREIYSNFWVWPGTFFPSETPETPPYRGVLKASLADAGQPQLASFNILLWTLPRCLSFSTYVSGWAQSPCRGSSFFKVVSTTLLIFQSLPKAHDHRWGLGRRLTENVKVLPFHIYQVWTIWNYPTVHCTGTRIPGGNPTSTGRIC